jgi:hypothetical protein
MRNRHFLQAKYSNIAYFQVVTKKYKILPKGGEMEDFSKTQRAERKAQRAKRGNCYDRSDSLDGLDRYKGPTA